MTIFCPFVSSFKYLKTFALAISGNRVSIPKEICYNFISCPVISPNTLIIIAIKTIIANIFVYFSLLEFNYLQKYPGVLTTFDKKRIISPGFKNLI